MKKFPAFKVAGVIFVIVAAAHLLRVIFRLKVVIGNFAVPMWLSAFGFIVPLSIAIWIFKSIKSLAD